jgi:hypothetical protein
VFLLLISVLYLGATGEAIYHGDYWRAGVMLAYSIAGFCLLKM